MAAKVLFITQPSSRKQKPQSVPLVALSSTSRKGNQALTTPPRHPNVRKFVLQQAGAAGDSRSLPEVYFGFVASGAAGSFVAVLAVDHGPEEKSSGRCGSGGSCGSRCPGGTPLSVHNGNMWVGRASDP